MRKNVQSLSILLEEFFLCAPPTPNSKDKVFLSDTIYIPENKKFEKLTIVSSATIFAETISRVHKGESVSQLFGEVT